jgi:hypothetical protein
METVLAPKEVRNLALQAYLQVWRDHHVGFCPPPGQTRDKTWSRKLREMWPEYSRVKLGESNIADLRYSTMRTWCDGQPSSNYWVNGGGNIWYFERRAIAVMFKLTFGGVQFND